MPAELLVGPCVEVWSDDAAKPWSTDQWPALSAWANWSRARRRHARLTGSTEGLRRGAPYSVEYLIATDRAGLAAKYLARAGADVTDLNRLRAAAARHRASD